MGPARPWPKMTGWTQGLAGQGQAKIDLSGQARLGLGRTGSDWVGLVQAGAEEDSLEPGPGWSGRGQSIFFCKVRTLKRAKSVRRCHFFARGTNRKKIAVLGRGGTWPGWAGPKPERTVEGQSRLGWAGHGPGWARSFWADRARLGQPGPGHGHRGRWGRRAGWAGPGWVGRGSISFFLGVRTKTLNGPRPCIYTVPALANCDF